MLSNHLILCCPFLLLPSIFPSIKVFSNESTCHIRWPKYRSFSIHPSNECSSLASFKIHWFDLFAVQGTIKSLLWHHSLKASFLRHSAFFMVQISHLYTTTGKTITVTIQTFVVKVMSLLFNMLSMVVIAFLPRASVLILWLQSLSTVILEPKKMKSATVSIFPRLFAVTEKAMAPHSSTLAWKILWTEEPGGLQSMGLLRVGHDWCDLAAAAAFAVKWWDQLPWS